MKKISILLLHMQYGGIEKQTITLANELSKKYEVDIISTYSMKKNPAYEVNKNIKIKYLLDDQPNRDEFKEAVKNKNIIKIIKQGFKSIKILYLKNYLMKKQVKNIKSDYILSTRIEFAKILSKCAPKECIKITQEHCHNDSPKYIKNIKKSFRNLDYLVVLSPKAKENYSKWLIDNKNIKIVEIPNILEKIPEKSSELRGNRILSVGRLHPVKDFSTLLQVFYKVSKKIDDATLTIVGDGEEYEKLKILSKELDIEDKVSITGMLSKEEVETYMLNSDLYVMTSLTECFPMVLLEASSCGLPLIAFDVPVGPKAIIIPGENGFLVEEREKQKMADIIIDLLTNKEKSIKLAEYSKKSSYKYLPENIMKLWDNIFLNKEK